MQCGIFGKVIDLKLKIKINKNLQWLKIKIKTIWKKLEWTCRNEPPQFHHYTLIETKLSMAHQATHSCKDTLAHGINMRHINSSNWIPPRTEYFNSFMPSPISLTTSSVLKSFAHLWWMSQTFIHKWLHPTSPQN